MVRRGADYPGIGDWVVLGLVVSVSLALLLPGTAFRLNAAKLLRGSVLYPFRLVLFFNSAPQEPADELELLRYELATQRLIDSTHQAAMQDNERLREQLGFARRAQHELTPAQIVGRAPDRWGEILIISRGSREGACVGRPILGVEGLIGVIVSTEEGKSWVKTLRHGALQVCGMLQDGRYVGMLSWNAAQGLLDMEGIPIQSQVSTGEMVITSGYGGVFPKALRIGEVVSVRDDSTSLVKHILVRPLVDLDRTEEVFLLVSGAETGG
ncbi:MAG: rod shape-determining protein MreC [Candidatus Eisenbacteria sp.]|nr:rod shape-determining protein MreC [Candidatus Eisenbacteria bacterium]